MAMTEQIPGEWLPVADAAEQIGISERALQRALDSPENAARTRQETRQTEAGMRQVTVLDPELVAELVSVYGIYKEHPLGPSAVAGTGDNIGTTGTGGAQTPAWPQFPGEQPTGGDDTDAPGSAAVAEGGAAITPVLAELDTRIARIEGAIIGGAMAKLDERLGALPNREELQENLAQAIRETTSRTSEVLTSSLVPIIQRLDARMEALSQETSQANAAANEATSEAIATAMVPIIERMDTQAQQAAARFEELREEVKALTRENEELQQERIAMLEAMERLSEQQALQQAQRPWWHRWLFIEDKSDDKERNP